jgi:hypothetical protein
VSDGEKDGDDLSSQLQETLASINVQLKLTEANRGISGGQQ